MEKPNLTGISAIVVSAIILSLTILYKQQIDFATEFPIALLSFLIIIAGSIGVKKLVAYHYEADISTKFWEFYQFGFRKGKHLKKSLPMIWFPIVLALFSQGHIWWMGILQFDIKAKPERVSKRHGLYRFSEMTEWHIAVISAWGVVACLVFSVVGYVLGLDQFAKLAIFYATWSIIPFSNLDGSKIFFGNRALWATIATITGFFLASALMI